MSIVNRMLQELDRRNAIRSDASAQALAAKVRPVTAPGRLGSEAFWRAMAVLMALALAWVAWVAWQLTPRQVVTPLALQAASKKPATAPVVAATPLVPPETSQPQAQAGATAEPPSDADSGRADALKLATELSMPVTGGNAPERAAEPAAPKSSPEPSKALPPPVAKPSSGPAKAVPPAAPAKASPASKALVADARLLDAPREPSRDGTKAPPAAKAAPAAARPAIPPRTAAGEPRIQRSTSQSAHQRAEREYQRALGIANQGRVAEGIEILQGALGHDPAHEAARQTLATLLIEGKRFDEAVRLLRDGLALNPMNLPLAMRLARVHVERGDISAALAVLESHSQAGYLNAEYHGFRAALYQRAQRHRDAVGEFDEALKLSPGSSTWWIGRGISLQATDRPQEALASFRRAKQAGNLSADLTAFVDLRIRQLQ